MIEHLFNEPRTHLLAQGDTDKSLAFAFKVGPFARLDRIGPVIRMLFRIALKHFQLHLPERITATPALGEIAVIVCHESARLDNHSRAKGS